jgi:hypothetical protein
MIFQFKYPVAYLTSPLKNEVCNRRHEVVWKTLKNRGRWHRAETRAEWAPSADQIEKLPPVEELAQPSIGIMLEKNLDRDTSFMSGCHKLRMAVLQKLCGLRPNVHLPWPIPLTKAPYLMKIPVNYSSPECLLLTMTERAQRFTERKNRASSFIRAI